MPGGTRVREQSVGFAEGPVPSQGLLGLASIVCSALALEILRQTESAFGQQTE